MVSIPNTSVLPGHDIEFEAYMAFLNEKEKELVEAECGKKNALKKSSKSRRYKTKSRKIHTAYGTIVRRFVYVINEIGDVFSPLLKYLKIEKHQHASTKFKEICAKKASRNPYRDTSIDLAESNNVDISHATIWSYSKDASDGLKCTTESEPSSCDLNRVLMSDGTKAHNRDGGKHELRAVISIGNKATLLSFTVNESWQNIVKNINLIQYDAIVADAEPGLYQAFNGIRFQLCHIHAIRDTGYCLWEDGLKKKESELYVSQLESILYTLQNSTKKYWIDRDDIRLMKRIEWTKIELRKLIRFLRSMAHCSTADFLERHIDHLTTAAELAISKGIRVPWTTNQIERMMREIGKRTKKKGMCWSEDGLTRIVSMNLKRYMVPFKQRKYLNLFGDNNVGVEV